MITLFATIFVFGIVVLVHEWGHFITAKLCGMRVDEFAIGFGPKIFSQKKGETLYSLRLIPLGGYNKIAGMDPEEDCDERGFNNKPIWQRFIVISAGAIMNFILAILIYFAVLSTQGISVATNEAKVGDVIPQGPAQIAHLQKDDRILQIDGQKIHQWNDIHKALSGKANTVVPMMIERKGITESIMIIPKEGEDGHAIIGIYPSLSTKYLTISEAATMSVSHTLDTLKGMLLGLERIFTGKEKGGLAGPIGVAHLAGQVAQQGFTPLLMLTALISINLGIINLLPVPVLDGGYLVMLLIEGITRRKLPTKALFYIQMVGLTLLGSLFIYATYSDVTRLF